MPFRLGLSRTTRALLLSAALATVGCLECGAQSEVAVPSAYRSVDPNAAVLAAIRTMPSGGAYSVSSTASERLRNAIQLEPSGLLLKPAVAQPSYCSGATYLVFLRAVDYLARQGGTTPTPETLSALLVAGQRDGQGIWGRWNANGPGTARLFHELGLGRNFTDFAAARPGDFLKVFWTGEIGQRERGHSVVYLGTEVINGVQHVRFWSSNQPDGYGAKSVPRTKIVRAIFSRLERPEALNRAQALPKTDAFLAAMLTRRSTMEEMQRMCGF